MSDDLHKEGKRYIEQELSELVDSEFKTEYDKVKGRVVDGYLRDVIGLSSSSSNTEAAEAVFLKHPESKARFCRILNQSLEIVAEAGADGGYAQHQKSIEREASKYEEQASRETDSTRRQYLLDSAQEAGADLQSTKRFLDGLHEKYGNMDIVPVYESKKKQRDLTKDLDIYYDKKSSTKEIFFDDSGSDCQWTCGERLWAGDLEEIREDLFEAVMQALTKEGHKEIVKILQARGHNGVKSEALELVTTEAEANATTSVVQGPLTKDQHEQLVEYMQARGHNGVSKTKAEADATTNVKEKQRQIPLRKNKINKWPRSYKHATEATSPDETYHVYDLRGYLREG
ncbi:hypothetical protein B0T24DRAFT_598860 [Lasiosphaeria ovina]|uniref:Uncharacterized protein n=1 Tax=Lasiosphaeria ovina TaxID=92902 RepID=A0AAE0JUB7_9PEZI|nr:hypothetical protein B0T24DRAFT_598860 [Lasiosphaeria ovina]